MRYSVRPPIFPRRPGTNSTGGIKQTFVNMVMQDQTELEYYFWPEVQKLYRCMLCIYSNRESLFSGVGRYCLPVCLCRCLILIGSHKILTLMQILGKRGPLRKSTVKLGLKSVLDTNTCNWNLRNQTALEHIKQHPPTQLVRSNQPDIDQ